MPVVLKNLEYVKALSFPQAPDFGTKLAELLQTLGQNINNIEQQTNSNATGAPQTPPAINSVKVTASNGHFQVAINHEGAHFYRGVRYFVEHADNAQFMDAHIEDMGTSRNANLFLGNTTRFFRAYAAYTPSAPGPIAYHGSPNRPMPVTGGGSVPGPDFASSQGSGTGTAGQIHSGPGPVPFRTTTGKPPVR